ncbi:MAG: metallophosphoesterase [Maricaulaceae bacterium]|jgi:protein phosphatase
MASLAIRSDTPIRAIPDVHGELAAFEVLVTEARAEDRFIVQLGDIVDRGPDSAGALSLMFDLMDAGHGLMLMGNHEWKLFRALQGRAVSLGAQAERTLAELAATPGLERRFVDAMEQAPLYVRHGRRLFVHGAWDPAMTDPAPLSDHDHKRLQARALYGQTTGRLDPKGRPERIWDWVDKLPAGLEVVVGHDWRAPSVVLARRGQGGGRAVLLDLGAGKGGPLAYMDIEPDGAARFSHPLADWTGPVYEVASSA